jgi:arsenate reductase
LRHCAQGIGPGQNDNVTSGRMNMKMYGIKNCDTIKKARTWLDEREIAFEFHDYKSAGIDRGTLERWCRELGWETLLNRAGTTFRKLPEKDKEGLNEARAIELMLAQPSMIKRPVLDFGSRRLVGFKPESYARDLVRKK